MADSNSSPGPSNTGELGPESARAAWKAQVEAELAKSRNGSGQGFADLVRHTLAGERLEPLYGVLDLPESSGEQQPGAFPFLRAGRSLGAPAGLPWSALHRTERPHPTQANGELLEDLAGGLNGLWLRTCRGLRTGRDDDARGGVRLRGPADLRELLAGVHLDGIEVFLEAGACTVAIFDDLCDLARERGHGPQDLKLHGGFDLFGSLLDDGRLRGFGDDLERIDLRPIAERVGRTAGRMITISSLAVHRAGADAALELGYLVAAGLESVRGLCEAGLTPDQAAAQIGFRVPLDRELFGELAKLRALRGLWSRALLALGVNDAPAPHVQAISGDRTLSACDVWTNMLRISGHAFAGILGEADAIYLARFDQVVGPSSSLGRRASRNLHHLFCEESHLGEVIDPSGGAYYIEARTEGLAELGWQQFAELAGGAGLCEAIRRGDLASRIAASRERRAKAVAHLELPLLGTSQFAQLEGRPHEPGPADQAPQPGSCDYLPADKTGELTAQPLPELRDAEPFEQLRERAQAAGNPTVYLACLGRLRDHTARAGFARGLLTTGGLRTVAGDGTTTKGADQTEADLRAVIDQWESAGSLPVVCVCGTDEALDALGSELPAALRQAGARYLMIARPKSEATADYDLVIQRGIDVTHSLDAVLTAAVATQGVPQP